MHQHFKRWAMAATFALVTSTGAMAASSGYSVLSLGRHDGTALNDLGQVAGSYYIGTNQLAFYTGANGNGITYVNLPTGGNWGYATDINNLGQVVGSYQTSTMTGTVHGFVTGPNGQGVTEFGLPPLVWRTSITAINDRGNLMGEAPPAAPNIDGLGNFITDPGGSNPRALPFSSSAELVAMNATARVLVNDGGKAYITGADGVGSTKLATLGGAGNGGNALNASGQVVGASQTAGGIWHAYVTGANGVGLIDLGKTSFGNLGGDEGSAAIGINDLGQVIGQSTKGLGENPYSHVFITGANAKGVVDLNSLVSLSDGLFFSYAVAINNVGQLLVRDNMNTTYLLSPVPEMHTSGMMALGMLGMGMAVRRKTRRAKGQAVARA